MSPHIVIGEGFASYGPAVLRFNQEHADSMLDTVRKVLIEIVAEAEKLPDDAKLKFEYDGDGRVVQVGEFREWFPTRLDG